MITHAASLEREIAEEQEALGENLAELEHQAQELVDWRAHVRKSPLTMMGVAFGGGLLLATMAGPAKSRSRARAERKRQPDADSDGEPWAADDTWQLFKGALISAATTQVASQLTKLLPDFHEHFEEQRRERATRRRKSRSHSAGSEESKPGSEPGCDPRSDL